MASITLLGRARGSKKKYKACQVKSGPKRGKLKKGWRYGKRGNCIKTKGGR